MCCCAVKLGGKLVILLNSYREMCNVRAGEERDENEKQREGETRGWEKERDTMKWGKGEEEEDDDDEGGRQYHSPLRSTVQERTARRVSSPSIKSLGGTRFLT